MQVYLETLGSLLLHLVDAYQQFLTVIFTAFGKLGTLF